MSIRDLFAAISLKEIAETPSERKNVNRQPLEAVILAAKKEILFLNERNLLR